MAARVALIIVGSLVALMLILALFPVFATSREAARRAQRRSFLKQSMAGGGSAGEVASPVEDSDSPLGRSDSVGEAKLAAFSSSAVQATRKIIYTAQVDLVVEDLTPIQPQVLALVARFKGYVSGADVGGTPGMPRTASWKLRIPAQSLESFLTAVAAMGEIQRTHRDSQDVTEEFYDVQTRLRAKRVEEARLIRHLERSGAKLSDILAVERELSRVHEEIEQAEGRLRLLSNQTDFSTITLNVTEVKDYVPEPSTTLISQIGRTFGGSVGYLGDFGKSLLLLVVGLAPWLAVISLIGLPVWLLLRRRRAA